MGPGLRLETHLLGDNTNTEASLSLALLYPQPKIVQAGWLAGWLCQELKQTSPNAMLNSNLRMGPYLHLKSLKGCL